jgi:hypothetical protein
VEISTPADFSDTYYEIATIKSPYTFQVSWYIFDFQRHLYEWLEGSSSPLLWWLHLSLIIL